MTSSSINRHRWGERNPFPHKTERQCEKCLLVKVTRHEIDQFGRTTYWTEWWRGLDQIVSKNTPPCPGVSVAQEIQSERMAVA